MMTTMAAQLGALPLMLGHGTGPELRPPLGYAMVGGLLLSQALTLFTTPVISISISIGSTRGLAGGSPCMWKPQRKMRELDVHGRFAVRKQPAATEPLNPFRIVRHEKVGYRGAAQLHGWVCRYGEFPRA
jgi:hypothetical protein